MKTITAIIETPKGSAEKYSYDPKTTLFKLKKILPMGMFFPFDFGFIPHTKGQDGDPLDIILQSKPKRKRKYGTTVLLPCCKTENFLAPSNRSTTFQRKS
jgi:hypothetical protein